MSAKREEVPLGCNLGKALTISPMTSLLSNLVLRDSHVASLLGMTRQAGAAVHQSTFAVELSPAGLSMSAATDAIGLCVFSVARANCKCLPEIATAPLGPRNDKFGGIAPLNFAAILPASKAVTTRKGHAASVRRQSRQRLRNISRFSNR